MYQDRLFRQLALRDGFATVAEIGDKWLEEEGKPVICELYIAVFVLLDFFLITFD